MNDPGSAGGPPLPILQSDRLLLRPLCEQDAKRMFDYHSLPDVSQYQTWAPQSLEDVFFFIKRNQAIEALTVGAWYQLGIALRDTGHLIGDLGIHIADADPRQVEFGITVAPKFQRRGFAAEAATLLLSTLFVKLGKHRVFASTDPRNAASQALMERLGMRKEAHMVKSLWFKGEWADDVVYAILEQEWAEERKRRRAL
jgi:RimJ/RimL family protein N-acetyltransferase